MTGVLPGGLILVAEDEPAIAHIISMNLAAAGYDARTVDDGLAALAAVRTLRPRAVVLDVGLPGMDGIELCRQLRRDGDWTPVLFVTARDDEVDRVLGLELGGDDYVSKPFSPRELVARVGGVLRRADGPMDSPIVLRHDEVSVDLQRRQVEIGRRVVPFTATEFDLLAFFMSRPGQVFSREQLLDAVWQRRSDAGPRTVDVHVAQIRAKLGGHCPITTRRGLGYGTIRP